MTYTAAAPMTYTAPAPTTITQAPITYAAPVATFSQGYAAANRQFVSAATATTMTTASANYTQVVPNAAAVAFGAIDANHDGVITREEFAGAMRAAGPATYTVR